MYPRSCRTESAACRISDRLESTGSALTSPLTRLRGIKVIEILNWLNKLVNTSKVNVRTPVFESHDTHSTLPHRRGHLGVFSALIPCTIGKQPRQLIPLFSTLIEWERGVLRWHLLRRQCKTHKHAVSPLTIAGNANRKWSVFLPRPPARAKTGDLNNVDSVSAHRSRWIFTDN